MNLLSIGSRFMAGSPEWGDSATESITGRNKVWDCSYFVLRVLRQLLGDESFGRGTTQPKNTLTWDMFQYLTAPKPALKGWSLPVIGVSDQTLLGSHYMGSSHIAILLNAVHVTSSGLVPDPKTVFVMDLPDAGSHKIAVRPISDWGSFTNNIPVWIPGTTRPSGSYVLIGGTWITEVQCRLASDCFNGSDRFDFKPIP